MCVRVPVRAIPLFSLGLSLDKNLSATRRRVQANYEDKSKIILLPALTIFQTKFNVSEVHIKLLFSRKLRIWPGLGGPALETGLTTATAQRLQLAPATVGNFAALELSSD